MSTPDTGQQRQIRTPEELGSVISELRSLRRKTQFEVSAALSIDRSQLAHLEGGRSGRYLAHLLNILDHLGAELQIHWPNDPANIGPTRAPRAPALNAARPTSSPETTVLSTDRQAGSGTPALNAAGPTSSSETTDDTEPDQKVGGPTSEHRAEEEAKQMAEEKVEKMAGEQAEQKPEQDVRPEAEQESNSAQLTKITNQAMNVMAASQQLTGAPSRQTPTHPN